VQIKQLGRREFITLLGGAAAWPLAASTQPPVVGFLRPSTAEGSQHLLEAFRRGLGEAGFVEGRNVAIEYRWADERFERLPALADDLVRRRVALIVASGSAAANAAKGTTSAIPIVFVTAIDPIKAGLIANLARPGVTHPTSALAAQRIELVRDLVPAAKSMAVIVNLDAPTTKPFIRDLRHGADALGLEIHVANVTNATRLKGALRRHGRDRQPPFPGARRRRPRAVRAAPCVLDRTLLRRSGAGRGGRLLSANRNAWSGVH
jgi:ABC-type uncharacterized transport system substrate-binding protein